MGQKLYEHYDLVISAKKGDEKTNLSEAAKQALEIANRSSTRTTSETLPNKWEAPKIWIF